MRENSNVLDINEARRRRQMKKPNGKNNKKLPPSHKNNPRKKNTKKHLSRKNRLKAKVQMFLRHPNARILIIASIAFILSIVAVFFFLSKNAQEIFLDGKSVGVIYGTDTDPKIIQDTAIAKIESNLGVRIKVNEQLTSEPVRVGSRRNTLTEDAMVTRIMEGLTYQIEGASIKVDGIEIAVVKSNEVAEAIFRQIQESYIQEGANIVPEETSFVEDVRVESIFIDSEDVISQDTVFNMLTRTTEYMDTYTIVSGDSLWLVANRMGMTLDRLIEINENITIDTPVKIGLTMNVIMQKPTVSVQTVEEYTRIETEPSFTETVFNDTQPSAFTRVIQQGQDGEVEVTMRITRLNGMKIEEEEHSRNVIQEPVPEIIEVGTL